MNTNDFDFELPEELIAQTPLEQRDASKLLVIDPVTKEMTDTHFDHIIDQLNPGDALVMNNTRVLPARLYGEKPDTHGHVEFLLLKNTQGDQWEVLAKPAKRLKVGAKVSFGDGRLTATVTEELDHGGRIVEFNYDGIFLEVLESLGEMPLPPYIHEKLEDRDRYQTVYAKENGSAAAPTAGLHFTPELLQKIEAKGVKLVYLTLHVGWEPSDLFLSIMSTNMRCTQNFTPSAKTLPIHSIVSKPLEGASLQWEQPLSEH